MQRSKSLCKGTRPSGARVARQARLSGHRTGSCRPGKLMGPTARERLRNDRTLRRRMGSENGVGVDITCTAGRRGEANGGKPDQSCRDRARRRAAAAVSEETGNHFATDAYNADGQAVCRYPPGSRRSPRPRPPTRRRRPPGAAGVDSARRQHGARPWPLRAAAVQATRDSPGLPTAATGMKWRGLYRMALTTLFVSVLSSTATRRA